MLLICEDAVGCCCWSTAPATAAGGVKRCGVLPKIGVPLFWDDSKDPTAALLTGLDETASETIRLLLEILGWTTRACESVEDLMGQPSRIAFLDDIQFHLDASKILQCENVPPAIVVVGDWPALPDIGNCRVKIYTLPVPIDIIKLENIIFES